MVTSKTIGNGILRAVFIVALIYFVYYFLGLIRPVLIYLVVALLLSLIGSPILKFLKKRLKFNNTFATITTLLFFILIFAGFIMMFVPLISSQGANLSVLNTASIETSIRTLIEQISIWLDSHGLDSDALLNKTNLTSKLNLQFIPNLLNYIVGMLSSFGIGLASVLFITFFFLKDRAVFIRDTKKLLPAAQEEKILNSIEKTHDLLSRYFIGLLIQLTVVFILYLIVLLIFGIDNAFLIAFICAVLNIIPYIGPLIGSLLAALLTMLSNLGSDFQTETLPLTLYVLIGFWIVQIIDNNVNQPLIFSNSVKSHPLEIFLVILIAGFIFGILGMIVAVPIYTMLKVIAKEFFPNNPIIKQLTKKI